MFDPDALELIDGVDAVVLRAVKSALRHVQVVDVVLKLIKNQRHFIEDKINIINTIYNKN